MPRTWRPIDDVLDGSDPREPSPPRRKTVAARVRRGWSPDRAILTPVDRSNDSATSARRDAAVFVVLFNALPGSLTRAQVVRRVGCTPSQATRSLNHLRRRGLARLDFRGQSSRWTATYRH